MSILDLIKTAEANAQKARDDANLEVEKLIEETTHLTSIKVDELYKTLKTDEKNLDIKFQNDLLKLEKAVDESFKKESERLEKQASANQEKVHKFIKELVFKL